MHVTVIDAGDLRQTFDFASEKRAGGQIERPERVRSRLATSACNRFLSCSKSYGLAVAVINHAGAHRAVRPFAQPMAPAGSSVGAAGRT